MGFLDKIFENKKEIKKEVKVEKEKLTTKELNRFKDILNTIRYRVFEEKQVYPISDIICNHIDVIREGLKGKDTTLTELGTSEEELKSVRKAVFICDAKFVLSSIKKSVPGSPYAKDRVEFLNELLEEGNVTLSDIESDIEEINKFLK